MKKMIDFHTIIKYFLISLLVVFGLVKEAYSDSQKLILLIGDGLGPGQLGFLKTTWEYARAHNYVPDRPSAYDDLLKIGDTTLVSVKPHGYLVADSACAASSISTGAQCLPETLGFDEKGNPVELFSEFAKRKGIAVGLVSDTRITHATPAAFYARAKSRSEEHEIGKQLLTSNVSVALSAGAEHFKESSTPIIRTRDALYSQKELPVFGFFEERAMPNAFNEATHSSPSLLDMTRKAIEMLETRDRFFLMVEAGQIDWACHENDIAWLWQELLRFERVLGFLIAYVNENPDTTLMVISDHETGGLYSSYRRRDEGLSASLLEENGGYQPRYDFIEDKKLEIVFRQKKSLRDIVSLIRKEKVITPRAVKTTLKDLVGISFSHEEYRSMYAAFSKKSLELRKSEFPQRYEYYVDDDSIIQAVIGKYISQHSGILWSTGAHTMPLIPLVLVDSKGFSRGVKPASLAEVGLFIREFYN